MCGIAGVLNAVFNKDTNRFINDALIAGMLRGFDSTGIIQMDRNGKIWFDKAASEGLYFASSKVGKQFIEDTPKCSVTVVHHRWATQGAVTDENAHPFVVRKTNEEPLVGVHNGSLTTGWKAKADGNKYEVDSHWALAHIAKNGEAAFKDIHGPFCFAWVEADKRGKLFMARNSQRPMHVLFTEGRKSMLFASEPGMLSWLAERNGLKPENEILVLTPDMLYEFDTSGATVTYKSTPLPKTSAMISTSWQPQWTTPGKEGKDFIEKIKKAAKGELLKPVTGNDVDAAIQAVRDKQLDAEKKNEELGQYVTPDTVTNIDAVTNKTLASIVDDHNDGGAVVSQRQDDAPFLEDNTELVPTTWFDARSTKKAERELAVKIGFFRELYWLCGIVWDEDTGELLGEIDVWDKVNGKQTYTAVIRNISRARAHSDYIDNGGRGGLREGGWVVITGAREEKTVGTVFVCTELNMIGKSKMEEQRKKAN